MRITSVELHPDGSSNFSVLSFRDPSRQNPYNVKGITGLDADAIVAKFYGGSGSGTKKYYNLSLEKRDVVVQISLNPKYELGQTPSSLRDDIYRLAASSRTGLIEIQFKDGATVVAVVSGFVTKMEAAHFDKDPLVQITISCDDPILRSPDPVNVPILGLNPANTLLNDTLSTAPHGIRLVLTTVDTFPSLTIDDPADPDWHFTITPAGGFINGDVIYFSSEFNNKALLLTRGATVIMLGDAIQPGSVWPIMFPGENRLRFTPSAGVVWTTIDYHPTYWGV